MSCYFSFVVVSFYVHFFYKYIFSIIKLKEKSTQQLIYEALLYQSMFSNKPTVAI